MKKIKFIVFTLLLLGCISCDKTDAVKKAFETHFVNGEESTYAGVKIEEKVKFIACQVQETLTVEDVVKYYEKRAESYLNISVEIAQKSGDTEKVEALKADWDKKVKEQAEIQRKNDAVFADIDTSKPKHSLGKIVEITFERYGAETKANFWLSDDLKEVIHEISFDLFA